MSEGPLPSDKEQLLNEIVAQDERIEQLEEALRKIRERARRTYQKEYEEVADAALRDYTRRCPGRTFIAEDETVRCCLPEGHAGDHDWRGYTKLGIGRLDGWPFVPSKEAKKD